MRTPVFLLLCVPLIVSGCFKDKNHEDTTSSAYLSAYPRPPWTTLKLGGLNLENPGWQTYTNPEQLEEVDTSRTDEWDTEFARACNAAIPFKHCVAHVGSEPWGEEAKSFADLQFRAYVVPGTLPQHRDWIVKQLRALLKPEEGKEEDVGGWHRIYFRYLRHHFDYGGVANIDFRLKTIDDKNIIFVFMYVDFNNQTWDEIPKILDSVRVTKP